MVRASRLLNLILLIRRLFMKRECPGRCKCHA